jgi:isoleucyl-tRNA synthetase
VLTHGFVVDADGKKMSKSLGNVIVPDEVIKKHGAEILRLWVSASDYRDDIRISENILKQLSDAYRRIRNTSRFMLGNLYDFNPEKDAVDYDTMPEIDRFALHRLQELIERTTKAYQAFEFHVIYHSLYNFCIVDLSSFYLDVLKDRLYTSPPKSAQRRSAQTVLYYLLDALARIMAPIMAFTAEEIWNFMPEKNGKESSVHFTLLPSANDAWKDDKLAQRWQRLLKIRHDVTKALERARAEKLIGHSLDAAVTLNADKDVYDLLLPYRDDLRAIFIVSQANLIAGNKPAKAPESGDIEGLSILVDVATDKKCERCWIHDASVGIEAGEPVICSRCQDAMAQIV